MKSFKFILILSSLFSVTLTSCSAPSYSCSNKSYNNSYIVTSHSYLEVSEYHIQYEDVFKQDLDSYFVYFYLENCGHCKRLKDEILSFALSNIYPLKFVLYKDEIPLGKDIENTLGINDINKLFIQGVPSLINIKSKILVDHYVGEKAISFAIRKIKENIF